MAKRLFFLIPLYLYTSIPLLAQQQNLPLSREWGLRYIKRGQLFPKIVDTDTVKYCSSDTQKLATRIDQTFKPSIVFSNYPEKDESRSLFYRKLTKESLFIINDTADKFYLTIDPLFNFELGRDLKDSTKKIFIKTPAEF
ncbi:MAG: hypothetical protein ACHQHP_00990 [Bacteroidia bacterium]